MKTCKLCEAKLSKFEIEEFVDQCEECILAENRADEEEDWNADPDDD